MSARDRYGHVFGRIESLGENVSWSTGLSNMLEWLAWSTRHVLGVTKTELRQQIVEWTDHESVRNAPLHQKQRYVADQFNDALKKSSEAERYIRPKATLASPSEALRRAKYFSEDYLNKEFDIFWSLVSDSYLDAFYGRFTAIAGGGHWVTHGNSGLFANSTGIVEMQMDNLSYSADEALLVANELKLGGRKNRDQILKYALMFRLLRDAGFIERNTRFLLLFIGDKHVAGDWPDLIAEEIGYCETSAKSTARSVLDPEVVAIANSAEYGTTTWRDLIEFNEAWLESLDVTTQQVERKLLQGFNESLAAKHFMQA